VRSRGWRKRGKGRESSTETNSQILDETIEIFKFIPHMVLSAEENLQLLIIGTPSIISVKTKVMSVPLSAFPNSFRSEVWRNLGTKATNVRVTIEA
jgi:hypothetical protein